MLPKSKNSMKFHHILPIICPILCAILHIFSYAQLYTVWQSQSNWFIYKLSQENAPRRPIHWKKLGETDEYEKRHLSWSFPGCHCWTNYRISTSQSVFNQYMHGSTWSREFSALFLAMHTFWFLFVSVHWKEDVNLCNFQI